MRNELQSLIDFGFDVPPSLLLRSFVFPIIKYPLILLLIFFISGITYLFTPLNYLPASYVRHTIFYSILISFVSTPIYFLFSTYLNDFEKRQKNVIGHQLHNIDEKERKRKNM